MPGTRKLGKTTAQRKAMLRQQVTDFLDNGRMETTFTRAKEIAPMAEKMITLGKKKDMAAYRQALSFLQTIQDIFLQTSSRADKQSFYSNIQPLLFALSSGRSRKRIRNGREYPPQAAPSATAHQE